MHPGDDCDGDFLREGLVVSDFMLPGSDMIIAAKLNLFQGQQQTDLSCRWGMEECGDSRTLAVGWSIRS
jgi:hypothetical protein